MFTGIITDIGTITAIERRGDLRVTIASGYDMADVDLGASIACSGVCLTVVDKTGDGRTEAGGGGRFTVDVSGETVSKTADQWQEGRRLNLERALRLGDELGGHIVTGHVDGMGLIAGLSPDGDSRRIDIAVPHALAPYIAGKGSVTVDGVSLTVNDVADQADGSARFSVNIIPHTAAMTTLGALGPGDAVNIEIDVLARYLRRMEDLRPKEDRPKEDRR